MKFTPKPTIIKPFDQETFDDIRNHAKEVRRLFEGSPYTDVNTPPNMQALDESGNPIDGVVTGWRFNRWYAHRPPVLDRLHKSEEFVKLASELFGRPLKPSYCFLSMYGPEGICPKHTDRPQCQFTIDLQIRSDNQWPIYVEDVPYLLKDGEALCYSGTGQLHYRKAMSLTPKDARCNFMDLAFFHFVPAEWDGILD